MWNALVVQKINTNLNQSCKGSNCFGIYGLALTDNYGSKGGSRLSKLKQWEIFFCCIYWTGFICLVYLQSITLHWFTEIAWRTWKDDTANHKYGDKFQQLLNTIRPKLGGLCERVGRNCQTLWDRQQVVISNVVYWTRDPVTEKEMAM